MWVLSSLFSSCRSWGSDFSIATQMVLIKIWWWYLLHNSLFSYLLSWIKTKHTSNSSNMHTVEKNVSKYFFLVTVTRKSYFILLLQCILSGDAWKRNLWVLIKHSFHHVFIMCFYFIDSVAAWKYYNFTSHCPCLPTSEFDYFFFGRKWNQRLKWGKI